MNAVIDEARVAHKTLTLANLLPGKRSSFSPNLYRWMREYGHFYSDGGVLHGVYRVKPGTKLAESFGAETLLLGYLTNDHPADRDFIGVRLIAALCEGRSAGSWCYAGIADQVEVIHGFWEHYLIVGRCAIDQNHEQFFIGDETRYRIAGDTRTCLWCGAKQSRVLTTRTALDEKWV